MRISVSGSHSTGKTTLVDTVSSRLEFIYPGKCCRIQEVARIVIARGFPLNRDATIHSYFHYVLEQLRAERFADLPYVVSDRSLVDLLAYVRTNANPAIPSYFVAMLEEVFLCESHYFDLYCFLPVEFSLVMDDVRPADREYQLAIDHTLRELLIEYKLPYEIIQGDIESRTEKVIELVLDQASLQ